VNRDSTTNVRSSNCGELIGTHSLVADGVVLAVSVLAGTARVIAANRATFWLIARTGR
jgi:hypothetical protein